MSIEFQHEHATGMHDQQFLRGRVMRLQQSFVTHPRADYLVSQVLAGVCALSASPAAAAQLLDFVIAELSLARANLRGEPHLTCRKCGGVLAGGEVCTDATCPYSDWPQEVAISELETLSADEIVARHRLVRAEVHSDDHIIEGRFFANRWLANASDVDLVELAHQDWGNCEIADAVARSFEHIGLVAAVFAHCQQQHGLRRAIGFECTLRAEDALAWVRQHRPALWEQLSAARAAGTVC